MGESHEREPGNRESGSAVDGDPFLWLEDVTGQAALDWVQGRNTTTLGELTGADRFEHLRGELLEVLDADDRIPFVHRRGSFLYNFWQDAEHPQGAVAADHAGAVPAGQTRVGGAARRRRAGRAGGRELGLAGCDRAAGGRLPAGPGRAVPRRRRRDRGAGVRRGRGGGSSRTGSCLPEAKSQLAWIDTDRLYVGTDFGPGSLTTSGYPRIVQEWRRGTALAEAQVVFEGKPDDVFVYAHATTTPRVRAGLRHAQDRLLPQRDLPAGGRRRAWSGWRYPTTPTSTCTASGCWCAPGRPVDVGGAEYPAGTLLAARFEAFLAGDRELTVLFEPDAHTSLS